jgi:subtilase family serine protease
VPETEELNNVRYRAINIGPNLIIDFSTAVQAAAGATITVNDTVTNLGGGTAAASRTLYYLSTALVPGPTDPIIGFRDVPALPPGTVNTGSAPAVIPAGTAPGQYNLIAKVDSENAVNELIETNNLAVHTIRIGPDFTVSSMTAPTAAVRGASITVAETVKNLTVADAPGSVAYYYLSPDTTVGPSAVLIGQRVVPPILAGGLSTGSALSVIPADTVPGSYFIVVKADGPNEVPEYNEDNNLRSKAITINP